jgi:two-component system response regulator DesR
MEAEMNGGTSITPTGQPVRVMLVVEMTMLRSALTTFLATEGSIDVVAAVGCSAEVARLTSLVAPDIVVVDVDLSCQDCVSAAFALQKAASGYRLIVLLEPGHRAVVKRILDGGLHGMIERSASACRVSAVILDVARGAVRMDPGLVAAALKANDNPLTSREAEVLRIAATGRTGSEIADALSVSPGTVRNYIASAMSKTGTHTRIDAIRVATREGWLWSA